MRPDVQAILARAEAAEAARPGKPGGLVDYLGGRYVAGTWVPTAEAGA